MDNNIITCIQSLEEWNTIINTHENVLVDCFATWCRPCSAIFPEIQKLALIYRDNIKVIKLDIDDDDLQDIVIKYDISSIPTFLFFKKQNFVEELTVIGASISNIEKSIEILNRLN